MNPLKWLACCVTLLSFPLLAPARPAQETGKPAAEAPEQSAHSAPRQIQVASDVQAAKLVERVDPVYSKEAKKKHLEGKVRIRVVIDKNGRVAKTKVLNGNHLLAKCATEALRKWRYQLTLLNGQPVEVESEVEFHFHRHKWRVD